ncbi:hypothetical protein HHI36_005177 [Cryptolaemus montrouzieri]|uniref:Uncharacterized protein n=1 Tax=Cryptolaemus montrouzieri TaxID=559131 RepID=A0ABD2NTM6_9CUCU
MSEQNRTPYNLRSSRRTVVIDGSTNEGEKSGERMNQGEQNIRKGGINFSIPPPNFNNAPIENMGCLPQQTTSNLDVNLVKLISNVVCDTLNKVQNNALIVKERNVVNSNVQGVPSNNIDQLSRNLQSCHISNEFQSFSLVDISKIIPNFDGEGDLQPLDFLQF